ncbi:ABC transporter substrate-binding protein [Kineococcus rhizosphaerae]|uniref:Peptide/nickel transport system substrate-binding protein n=1 Tax=Kineococcus rhizosphaerae TaxID=559628 RepID=A0A2T0R9V3_9ACTN|nr:ABC transporter substrate-binding protein [Kineococcus rhizosphaerae]PRY17934.1 peptide/nickel transport system substrate-binding protein [Kineococcus rhizosphaerae]
MSAQSPTEHDTTHPSRRAFTLASVATAGLATLSACAKSERDEGGSSGGSSSSGRDTFVFGGSADPDSLDPVFASDGETFRITRQIFEGLVSTKPGTTELAPSLATKWTTSEDGLSYTFTLAEGVKFSNGKPFDAAAVVANFERWYNLRGIAQGEDLAYYYRSIFRGFKTNDDPALGTSLYAGSTANADGTVTVNLTSPFAGFLASLTLPAFAMQETGAVEAAGGNGLNGADPRQSEYATSGPIGTGPFVFAAWERGQQVTLKRNEDYWGEKAKVASAVVRVIGDGTARKQALQNGDIDGYDLVAPADVETLKSADFQIQNRPAFNILYLGMNQALAPLGDLKVRQAISHAIDKDAVIKNALPSGTKAATQFMPENVIGWNDKVTTYEYDVDKAKQLLAEAGQSNLTIPFNYPTGVSRPYMPNPETIYNAINQQLTAAGIKTTPVAEQWTPNYLGTVQGGTNHGLHLLGWTGDYNDPDNFIGVFFGAQTNEWGFNDPGLFEALAKARTVTSQDEQETTYQDINEQIMTLLPGIPIASPVPSLAFAAGVKGYTASPVQDEVWNTVTVADS